MRVVENYAGGKPSPLGDLPEEEFQMRRIMVSFLFAVCTSTLLWAQEVRPNWPIPSELKWEAINGYRMAYRDAGEGTPCWCRALQTITGFGTPNPEANLEVGGPGLPQGWGLVFTASGLRQSGKKWQSARNIGLLRESV
jgi:hypothetical protein